MAARSGLASAMPADLSVEFTALYGQMWSCGVVDHPTKEVARLRNARITDCGY